MTIPLSGKPTEDALREIGTPAALKLADELARERLGLGTSTARAYSDDDARAEMFADFDPTQPRDRSGKWRKVGGGGPIARIVSGKGLLKGYARYEARDKDGRKIGVIELTRDRPLDDGQRVRSISLIEVEPDQRHKGVATTLLDEARRRNPDTRIAHGFTTPDGSKWRWSLPDGWHVTVPSWNEEPRTAADVKAQGGPAYRAHMFVTPARSEFEDAETYYTTPRWRQFEADVRRQADALDVTIDREERTQGIWSETPEPSATYELSDGEDGIERLAARLGRRWNQDAVLNFTPGDGEDAEWHFRGAGAANDAAAIMRAAEQHGLFGATRNGEDVVVVVGPEIGGEDEAALIAFGEALGADEADRYPGMAHLIERDEYDEIDSP